MTRFKTMHGLHKMHRKTKKMLRYAVGVDIKATPQEVRLIPHFSFRCRARLYTYKTKLTEISCACNVLEAFVETKEKGGEA